MHWALIMALLSADVNYMKMLAPYEESPQDKEVLRILDQIEQAMAQQKPTELDAGTKKLRAFPDAAKSLVNLLKGKDARTRGLAAMGFRLLPIKRGFKDKLQYLMLDADPAVRRQVLLYVAQEPTGVKLESIQLALTDGAAVVRMASVGAIVKTADKPERAVALFKQRLAQEDDPNVIRAIKIGFTALGLPTPDVQKEKK